MVAAEVAAPPLALSSRLVPAAGSQYLWQHGMRTNLGGVRRLAREAAMRCWCHGRRRVCHGSHDHGNAGQGCYACNAPQMALTDNLQRRGDGQSTNPMI